MCGAVIDPQRSTTRLLGLAALLVAAVTLRPTPASSAEAKPAQPESQAEKPAAGASPLAIAAVAVTPPNAGADTLCRLSVDLVNKGDRIASQLAFTVKVNGTELPVYKNQLFMQRLDPGKTTTLRLYNFWTTETGRTAPADGKYKVEVMLASAKWYRIGTEDGVEVWTPLEAVPSLPVVASASFGR
jgi:hypothetical protein